MTTPQILVLSIIFILDLWLTMVRPIQKADSREIHFIMLNFARMLISSLLLLIGILIYNDVSNKANNKCPELVPVQETLYRIK